MKRSIGTLLVAFGIAIGCASVAIAGSSPAVSTGSASKIADTSATLSGSVTPQGTNATYQFEYGLTTQYGVLTKAKSAGSGTKAAAVTAGIGGLIPGTTYHYKLLATNKYGQGAGLDRTFKTAGHAPPVAATGPASGVHQFGATVTGTVDPNGQATTWEFQFGPSALYGYSTSPSTLPASNTTSVVSTTLTTLEPGVTIHYRLLALHGTTVISTGSDATFFTLPDPAPVPRVTASTTPRSAKHAPYVLTTNGTVHTVSSVPASLSCFGGATVTYFVGNRQVGSTPTSLLGTCAFSATKRFSKLPAKLKRHHKTEALKVVVHFRGNGYLAPSFSKSQTVTLG